jgi:hypothetical protein
MRVKGKKKPEGFLTSIVLDPKLTGEINHLKGSIRHSGEKLLNKKAYKLFEQKNKEISAKIQQQLTKSSDKFVVERSKQLADHILLRVASGQPLESAIKEAVKDIREFY